MATSLAVAGLDCIRIAEQGENGLVGSRDERRWGRSEKRYYRIWRVASEVALPLCSEREWANLLLCSNAHSAHRERYSLQGRGIGRTDERIVSDRQQDIVPCDRSANLGAMLKAD